ncbi:fimbrial biogenesis usher protein [Citrobacter sp. Awk 4]|uniref:fimbrial biogenesis usher protein n=1 Tax=Citrobacter sp. Awk 4 TaxID=2963955 RepID=UPI002303D00A|nr:fimbrial biogenesis usher protein [Citrobacter sp. Awk 4]
MNISFRGVEHRLNPVLFIIGVSGVCLNGPVYSEVYFNPNFLSGNEGAVVDLSGFEKGQELPPGTYRVDIYINDGFISNQDIVFSAEESGTELVPCLTKNQLNTMGVNISVVKGIEAFSADSCVPLTKMIMDATTRLDVSEQRLYVSVPQAFMGNHARGYIPPEKWDNGITAALLNYNLTGNSVNSVSIGTSNYNYLNLMSGLNVGAWRLRDNSSWSHSSGAGQHINDWQHINTWLERDIILLRGRLTFGDSFTRGEIFDGINYRGVKLESEDNMYPDSQKGFAPEIHGIAKGVADVTVQQNGYTIYQTTVPPGAFVINDLYATGSSGDLKVIVKEANGSTQVSTVPYSSVPILQREGHTRYAFTAGEYRSGNDQRDNPKFVELNIMQGLPYGWTTYGGSQLAEDYRALTLGVGKNLGYLGAASLDVTQANATLSDDSQHQGQSLRFLYNKSLNDYGTNIRLVGYRYSTQGFYTLADTAYSRMSGYTVMAQDGPVEIKPTYLDYYNLSYNKRGRVQLSLTQQLGTQATLYLSGSQQSYWRTDEVDEQLQAGLNMVLGDINLGMNYSLTKSVWQEGRDQLLSFNISVPFSRWMRSDTDSAWKRARVSSTISNDFNGRSTSLAGISGSLLADNNLSYSVQTGYNQGGTQVSGGTGYASLAYRGANANANAGYSQNTDSKQVYYGVSGGVLAHENGVTFSQPLNETVVLVKAPGADNVKVDNQTGIHTDWRGYTVLPYATDYRENRVSLNTNTLADNVDLDEAVVSVVPTHGAVVRADFKARVGLKVLMTLVFNGKPVPFGAIATADQSQSTGIVADNGQVYLTGLPLTGEVKVKWGNDVSAECVAGYHVPSESQTQALINVTTVCR